MDLGHLVSEGNLTISNLHVLTNHDAASAPRTKRLRGALTKLASRTHFDALTRALVVLPKARRSPGGTDPYERVEIRDLVRARHQSLCRFGVLACLRTYPFDSLRMIFSSGYVEMGRRFWGVEPRLAARGSCCSIIHADTHHARLCPRVGAQVAQHQPLINTLPDVFKRLSLAHSVEDGAPFLPDRDLRMSTVVLTSKLRDASIPVDLRKGLFIDGNFANPQAMVHLRNGNDDADGSAASCAEGRKSVHYVRPDHTSFEDQSYKPHHSRGGKIWAPRQEWQLIRRPAGDKKCGRRSG